jgi:hypothetical protein
MKIILKTSTSPQCSSFDLNFTPCPWPYTTITPTHYLTACSFNAYEPSVAFPCDPVLCLSSKVLHQWGCPLDRMFLRFIGNTFCFSSSVVYRTIFVGRRLGIQASDVCQMNMAPNIFLVRKNGTQYQPCLQWHFWVQCSPVQSEFITLGKGGRDS